MTPFSEAEFVRVGELLDSGKSQREIAQILGRPRTSIQRVIKRIREVDLLGRVLDGVEPEPVSPPETPKQPERAPLRTAPRQAFGFTLTPSVEMVEAHGGVDLYVSEVVQRIPMPGWQISVRRGEDDRLQALMIARTAAKGRGADLVVYDRERLIVSERPAHAWDRTPEELATDAYFVIPVVATPA